MRCKTWSVHDERRHTGAVKKPSSSRRTRPIYSATEQSSSRFDVHRAIFVYLRFSYGQTPLQHFYTPIYARSAVQEGAFNKKGIPTSSSMSQASSTGAEVGPHRNRVRRAGRSTTPASPNGKQIPLARIGPVMRSAEGLACSIAVRNRKYIDALACTLI